MGKNLKGKELGEGLSQRKDGRYIGRYTTRWGERKTIYGKTLKEVKENLTKLKYEEQFQSGICEDKNITLDKVYDMWCDYKKNMVRPQSMIEYRSIYRIYIKEKLGLKRINDINAIHVEDILLMASKNVSNDTAGRVKMVLNNIFTYAITHKICSSNPCKYVIELKNNKTTNTSTSLNKFLTPSQRKFFLDFVNNRRYKYKYLFQLMMYSGLRLGEGLALTWEDINFDIGYISVTKTISPIDENEHYNRSINAPKTTDSIRKVPLNRYSYDALIKQQQKTNKTTGYIFETTNSTIPLHQSVTQSLRIIVKRINEELSKKGNSEKFPNVTSHYFRHTFATICLEQGIPPKVVQRYLGHANINITMNLYTHVSDELLQSEMKKINNLS